MGILGSNVYGFGKAKAGMRPPCLWSLRHLDVVEEEEVVVAARFHIQSTQKDGQLNQDSKTIQKSGPNTNPKKIRSPHMANNCCSACQRDSPTIP